jgi:hypothetical protein
MVCSCSAPECVVVPKINVVVLERSCHIIILLALLIL